MSDICRTTSVSGVGDQTRDSYIVVYNAKKYDVIGLRKCVSFQDRKSPGHGDWWNVLETNRSYFRYNTDICRTTSVSGVNHRSRATSSSTDVSIDSQLNATAWPVSRNRFAPIRPSPPGGNRDVEKFAGPQKILPPLRNRFSPML